MKLLKSIEEKQLEKARIEASKQARIIENIEQKRNSRQSKINALKQQHKAKAFDFQYRCENFGVNEQPFIRLALFFGHYAPKIKSMSRDELLAVARECHLEEVMELINKTGSKREEPPHEPNYDVLDEE